MAPALVGTIGTVVTATAGNSASPSFGASENRTEGNLLVLYVTVTGTATLPTTPTGWIIGKQVAGTSCSTTIYHRPATGSDSAPTVAGIASGVLATQLAEFSGVISGTVNQSGTATGTSSPITATNGGADTNSGSLQLASGADFRSVARSPSDTWTGNHVTFTAAGNNNGTSSVNHYSFAYGNTTSNSGADTAIMTLSVTTSITGLAIVDAVFKNGVGTFSKLAQAQAYILNLNDLRFAQANAYILNGHAHAQANAYILNGHTHAQAQAKIKGTPTVYSQAQADIKQKYPIGYSTVIAGDTAVAYWRLDEPSGTTADDYIGVADGTYTNTPTLGVASLIASDPANKAITLDKTQTESVQITAGVLPAGSTTGYSVELWINHPGISVDGEEQTLWSQGAVNEGHHRLGYRFFSSDTYLLSWYFRDSGQQSTTIYSTTGNFLGAGSHHVVVTHDYLAKSVKTYVDNSLVSTTDLSAFGTITQLASGLASRIGGYMGNDLTMASGTLDEVAIYSYVLSATQVTNHYNKATLASSGSFAQAQADIKAVSRGFAQAQSDIKATSNGFAQAQSDIKAVSRGFAQSQADIKAVSRGFAQAQADIKQTYPNAFSLSYATAVLADSPVAYWRLGEASGNPQDSSGNGNHVNTVSGTPTYGVAGAINDANKAVAFGGSSNFSAPSASSLAVGDVFTLEAWFYITSLAGGSYGILSHDSGSGYLRILNTGELTANAASTGIIARSTVNPSVASWHHGVYTKNGSDNHLYLDGVDVTGAVSDITCTANPGASTFIGAALAGTEQFNGSIDEAAVYNYALTPTQVRTHYSTGIVAGRPFSQAQADIKQISWGFSQAQAKITYLLVCGFEDAAITTHWSANGVTSLDSSIAFRSQTNAAKIDSNGAALSDIATGFSSAAVVVTTARFLITAIPSTTIRLFKYNGQTLYDAAITLYSDGSIDYSTGAAGGASAVTIVPNRWYTVSFWVDGTAKTGGWTLDGVAQPNPTAPAGTETFNGYYAGKVTAVDAGSFSIYLDDIVVSLNVSDFPIPTGYVASVNSNERWITYTLGSVQAQAQAKILTSGAIYVWSQAQADVKTTYSGFAQSQADIKATSSGFAQAQTDVKAVSRGLAQAQSDIKATSSAFSQAQADIKQISWGFAQSQADIKAVSWGFAQSQADIKQTYNGFAQAQSDIKAVGFGLAQAQAKIIPTKVFSQAQADIKATSFGFAQAQTKIIPTRVFAQSQADIKAINWGFSQSQADIKAVGYGFAQAQSDIKATSNGFAQGQADIKQTYFGLSQAQADIKQTYNVWAQAQATLATVARGFAQSQADIKATSSAFSQAQADIKAISWGFAQAQADIKTISRGYAQAQTDILTKYTGFAQGNARIIRPTIYYISPTGNDITGDGSIGNPWLKVNKFASIADTGDTLYCRGGTYNLTTLLRITGTPSGSAASPITVKAYPGETPIFHGGGSANKSGFLLWESGVSYWIVDGLTLENWWPNSSGIFWVGDATLSTHHIVFRNNTFNILAGMTNSDQGIYLSYHADYCTIEDNIFIGAQVGGDGGTAINVGDHDPSPVGFLIQRNIATGFGDTGAFWINGTSDTTSGSILHNTFQTSRFFIRLVNHTDVIVRDNAGDTAIFDEIDTTSYYTGGATIDHNFWDQSFESDHSLVAGSTAIKAASDGTNAGAIQFVHYRPFAQAQAKIVQTYQGYAQAQADIKATSNVWAQSQADIKAIGRGFAQAQADVKTTYQAYAQSQADIKNTYQGYAQSAAWIEQTYNQPAQANADIKAIGYGFGQAQAKLNAFGVQGYGQAQCYILSGVQKFAQAQAKIKAFGVQGYGQSQADIKATSQGYAQAQADILHTYTVPAQAQADIKNTYQGYSQAQTDVKATSWGFSQSQADIKQISRGYSQAQADVKAVSVACGQAQALVGVRAWGFGQAQADVKSTTNNWAQANADIKSTTSQFSQAQAYITTNLTRCAQAQAYIKITDIEGVAQAQAQIKQTSNSYSQAQSDIKQTYTVSANAQADTKVTVNNWAQAQTQIKATYQAYAQAQAAIQNGARGVAQAQAQIQATYQGYAQAQAQIIKSAGYSQAQAYIRIVNFLKSMTISDRSVITLSLSDGITISIGLADSGITLGLEDSGETY